MIELVPEETEFPPDYGRAIKLLLVTVELQLLISTADEGTASVLYVKQQDFRKLKDFWTAK